MKNLQLQMCLLIWFVAVAGLKFVQVEMGGNITVQCALAHRESNTAIFWYVQKQCGAPELILRSIRDGEERVHYYNAVFKEKFSLQVSNSLLIQSITEDELGDYYCVETGKPIVFSNGLRLNSTGRTSEIINKTEQRNQQPPQHTPWPSLTLASALLNCIFIIPVIALLTSHCKNSSKDRLQPPDPDLQQHQDVKREEYAESNLPTSDREVRRCQENSIYALLQHPSP
ncbi:uncharacterized protein LOC108444105 isoform X3 [Pygocentrus nattereri]|uniref:uncharacterized protein LOC108444105 isoform X3 n=1 Tax=Pygocentrus nattereri TaxID=42514 RepID=UPI001891A8CD|nr:uncharacterized protein LOC108444105 isoform X3 [Pygocentrus nattereri]